ncbi:MAG: hypothetical protein DMG96_31315 [Acidobacteria bacterium]|nr:MAG: hypothetical protein DMG98_04665 [Acidobacteriota bacterium]PYV70404.1 MAG: hypothetical protein DMG96_31315 [Acidobacteriota bacterium]
MDFMAHLVNSAETDDRNFIAIVNSVAHGIVNRSGAPNELWIIHIDNWFDHKWLRFSGTGRVDFAAVGDRIFTARVVFSGGKRKLNFPPFSPNRVLEQKLFVRTGDDYSEAPVHVRPHAAEKRPSETNLHVTLQEFSRSASFIWYSGNTLANGKGSVMVYSVVEDLLEAWFAAFTRQQGWRLSATKGINREHLEALLQTHAFNACEP